MKGLLGEYDFAKLQNIIDNVSKISNNKINNNLLNDNMQKQYSEIAPYEIDKWGLMYYYLQSKNKQTNKLINDYYGKKQVETLNKLLKKQNETFFEIADILFKSVQDWDELNVYYVLEFNNDMGQVDNYFPRVSFHTEESNIFDMLTANNYINNRDKKITAIESRGQFSIPNLNNNPLLLAIRHIQQTEFTKTTAVELNKNFQAYYNMFFNRYYKSIFDLYDSEKTKEKKEKREETKERNKE